MRGWGVLFPVMLTTACGLAVSGTATSTDTEGGGLVGDAGLVDDAGSVPDGGVEPPTIEDGSVPADANPVSPITHVGTSIGTFQNPGQQITSIPVPPDGTTYLVAIATKPFVHASTVLENPGPSTIVFTLQHAQCGERNQTGVEVWYAKRTNPNAPNPLTVQFQTALSPPVENAVVAISAFKGAQSIALGFANTNPDASCVDGDENNEIALLLPYRWPNSLVYAAVAMRQRVLSAGDGVFVFGQERSGQEGAAAGLAILGTTNDQLNAKLNASTGWALVAVELRP